MSPIERVSWFVTGYTMILLGVLLLVWTFHQWLLLLDESENRPTGETHD